MRKEFKVLLTTLSCVFSLSSCDFFNAPSDQQAENNKQGEVDKSPKYTGMNITKDATSPTKTIKRDSSRTVDDVIEPNEEFIFEIHFENPYGFEIQSFTINNVKYVNYMFEKGSNLEVLYLKSQAPSEEGDHEYTIDAIKYIDGENIKNVTIQGNKTITVKIAYRYEQFKNYHCVTSVKDGGRYLLGAYKYEQNVFRFINGDYHRDYRGPWSYFMETTENTTEGAVEVEAKFVSEDEFTLQVIAPGCVWDQKYISLYLGSSLTANPSSTLIVGLDNVGDTDFTQYSGERTNEVSAQTVSYFKYYEYYDDNLVRSIAATYSSTETEPFEIFLGITGVYKSIDSKMAYSTIGSDYDLARLYEKID